MTHKELIKRLRTLQKGSGDVMHGRIGQLINDVLDGITDDLNIRDERMAPRRPGK